MFGRFVAVLAKTGLKNYADDLVVGSQERKTEGHCYRKTQFLVNCFEEVSTP